MAKRLVVIAGTHRQFDVYCRERNLNPRRVIDGNHPYATRGFAPECMAIVFTGSHSNQVGPEDVEIAVALGAEVRFDELLLSPEQKAVAHAY